MSRYVGTVARGIRTPIIREGDDLATIVADSIVSAADNGGFCVNDRDVIAVTEAVLARAQGNYATVDDIAADVKEKFGAGAEIGVTFPIMSRNRFAVCLRGIARGVKKVTLMLSYPSDEVGNHLMPLDLLDEKGVDPWKDVLSIKRYRELFGTILHPFTGIDYVDYYSGLVREEGAELEVVFANDVRAILEYSRDVLCCDIHTRCRSKRLLKAAGAGKVYSLDEILNTPAKGRGCNEEYGILGSNKCSEEKIKLFPRDAKPFVDRVQKIISEKIGKRVEVMVYGDGAFKDPVGKIWELADPVVSPAYTAGLEGTPNELKLKYLADNQFAHLDGEELRTAITCKIKDKDQDLTGKMETQGTTPRRLTDLIGSLCDLISGSGDKGTPVVLVQGYFDNYAD